MIRVYDFQSFKFDYVNIFIMRDRSSRYNLRNVWPVVFLKDILSTLYGSRNRSRKKAHEAASILQHLQAFQAAKDKYGILDQDVYNSDETGFRIGCGRVQ